MTAQVIGYLALAFGLAAMAMKRLVVLRLIHMLSALAYIVYGLLIDAFPLVLGGSLFILIHGFHLIKLRLRKAHEQK